jgi:hypothetical protein
LVAFRGGGRGEHAQPGGVTQPRTDRSKCGPILRLSNSTAD